jgi:RNA polymerase sigma factor (sigma-70 family)
MDSDCKDNKMKINEILTEANPRQQASVYNPNSSTYRGEKMPGYGSNDILQKSQQVDRLSHQDIARQHPGEDDSIEKTEQNIDRERLLNLLRQGMQSLPPKLREVISMRFFSEMTLDQVANKLGLTVERIRQLEAKALRQLRHPSRSNAFKAHF